MVIANLKTIVKEYTSLKKCPERNNCKNKKTCNKLHKRNCKLGMSCFRDNCEYFHEEKPENLKELKDKLNTFEAIIKAMRVKVAKMENEIQKLKLVKVNYNSNVEPYPKHKENAYNINQDKVIAELKKEVSEKVDVINTTNKKCNEAETKLKEKTTEYDTLAKVAGQMFNDLKEFNKKESENTLKNNKEKIVKNDDSATSSQTTGSKKFGPAVGLHCTGSCPS